MIDATEETTPTTALGELKSQSYSKAFENFVKETDDTVGLLAYALFKQTINEDAVRGVLTESEKRNPGKILVERFRDSAHRKLEEFGSKMVDEARPILQRSAVSEALSGLNDNLESVQANLITCINEKTRIRYGILASLAGWLISIALTILLVTSLYLPNLLNNAIDQTKKLVTPPTEQTTQPKVPND